MVTRLVGVDSVNRRLPQTVITASQGVAHADLAPGDVGVNAKNYTDERVDELADVVDSLVITGGGMAPATPSDIHAGIDNTVAATPANLASTSYGAGDFVRGRTVGDAVFADQARAANLPYLDIRWFGAVADFDVATQTVVTDSTAAIQAAIDAATPGGTIYVPPCPPGKGFAHGPVTVLNPCYVKGRNRYTSRLVALPTATGALWNVQVGAVGVDLREESHGFGFQMSDLYLDGAQRVPAIAALRFSQYDRIVVERCQVRNFARQALDFAFSIRESEFRSLYIRWCGSPGYPAIDVSDQAGADQTNNIAFHGTKVLYSFGEALRAESAAQSVRLLEFDGCMFHNMTPAMLDSGVGYADADGWTPTLTGRELETPLIHLVDARGINFRGCRLHQGGYGQPLVMQRDGTVAGPKSARFTNCSLGDVSIRQLTGVAVAGNVFTSTGHRLGTGALVRVTASSLSNSTDYWVIRVSANTFQLASSLTNAFAGTPVVTVTDATGITVDTQQRQLDTSGTNAFLGVAGSDATNGTTYRACIIDQGVFANRVSLTTTFFLATTGIESTNLELPLVSTRLAAGCTNQPRELGMATQLALVSGDLFLSYFKVPAGFTAANIAFYSGGTAAGATPTLVEYALFTVASNGNLTRIAAVTSDTGIFAAPNARYPKAFGAPVALLEGQVYATGLLLTTAAALPTVLSAPGVGATAAAAAQAPRLMGRVTGQTAIAATYTSASVVNTGTRLLAEITI